jgi:tripeptide aminopeptidase
VNPMNDIAKRVIELAAQIQQIPAPTFDEKQRGEFVKALFQEEDLKDVSMDPLGNVYGRLPGKQSLGKPLIITAHLDTVFPAGNNLHMRKEAERIFAPGIGDNSLGVSALFGVIWSLRQRGIQLEHESWLVANVGEEGLGDLRGMRGVVDRFGKDVIGYLILEGLALGHVYHRAIGVRRYRIHVKTAGGHSWSDYGQPSAVHELASIVTQLTAIKLPHEPRTTMNVGTIGGGTGINVLAAEAKCELDLRSEDPNILMNLAEQIEEMLAKTNRKAVKVTVELIGERPAGEIMPEHPFVQLALTCLRKQDLDAVLTAGSTDANIPLSLGIPAVVMGITTGGGAHTTNEYINIGPIKKGMDSIVGFVEKAFTC